MAKRGGRLVMWLLLLLSASVAQAQSVTLTPGWATFGYAFPPGAAVGTTLQVGTHPTQADVKCRWADGSIKFAVITADLTGEAPALTPIAAKAAYSITAGQAAPPVSPVPLDFTARITTSDGKTYFASVPNSPSKDAWLAGPLVTECRYRVVPTTIRGESHPFLTVLFDVRTYRDGSHRVDTCVESVIQTASAGPVTYSVDLIAGEEVIFSRASVTQAWLTRWRHVWDEEVSASGVVHDFAPFVAANALPRYRTKIKNVILDYTKWDILSGGSLDPYMGNVGGRAEIAPYPDWAARFLVYQDEAQKEYVKVHGDLAGSWPIHLTETDGRLWTIDAHPGFWLDYRGDVGNRPLGKGGGTNLAPELNHVPSLAYVPYLVTGDRYYLDEMKFWANYALLATYQNVYQNARGGSAGLLSSNQVRGIAWNLRNLADAAAYLPDGDPLKAYFGQKLANNLKWFDTYAGSLGYQPLGTSFEDKRPENQDRPQWCWVSLWEQNYLGWAIDHTNKHGIPGGTLLRDRIGKFQLSLFTSPQYDRRFAAPYRMVVATRANGVKSFYLTLADLFRANYVNATTGVTIAPQQFQGYYGVDARLMLMLGIEQGWAGSQAAYDWLHPQLATGIFGNNGCSDLDWRAGWAIEVGK